LYEADWWSRLKELKGIKVVLFDIDDTLFDTATLAKMARMNAVKAMIESGLPIANVQKGYRLLMKIVEKHGANYDQHFDRLLEALGCKRNAKIIAAGIVAYHDTKIGYLNPDPDVIPTLIALRDIGCKIGIVSNGRPVKQWEKIIRLGLHHFFHTVIISEEAGFEKPDPRIFKAALNELGARPEETVYVGDSLEIDMLGANEAGIISVRLMKKEHKEPKMTKEMQPKTTIKKISKLLDIIKVT
jgi:putative hydrolase of the HAD superfamily